MELDIVLKNIKMIKSLKHEVNKDIKNHIGSLNINKLEVFEFMHKIEKLDILIDNLESQINSLIEDSGKASIDKTEILKSFDNENTEINNKEKRESSDVKEYIIGDNKYRINKNFELEKIKIHETDEEEKKSIDEAYKRIANLEKLIKERKLIEKDEELIHMKDIHSREEREAMLSKRHIKAESFTPKAKKQSDPEMDKTVAMSKEEFYERVNSGLEETMLHEKPVFDHTIQMNANDYLNGFDKTEILDKNDILNHEDYEGEDDYDLYEEEKDNSLLGKFKDFLGK